MGVTGLLGLLKSIQTPCHLKSYAGQTLGVDGYGWLHRGLISCSTALALDKPTRKYVDYALNRVRMLIHFGIIPYIVLDGNYLPSKALTETSRAVRRENAKKHGLELLRQGRTAQAHLELQKAIDLTPEMVKVFIDELDRMKVQYLVAPYEADAQLVYLEKKGLVDGILSEDSDLLVFGAQKLITKLDQYGTAISISRADFGKVVDANFVGWTDAEFRTMAIMSGCDYLKNIPGLGLKKSYLLVRKYKTIDRIVKVLQLESNFRVPSDYLQAFREAEQAFLFQWVFCPIAQTMVNLSDPSVDPGVDISSLPHIGSFVEDSISREVAAGKLDPHTKLPLTTPFGLNVSVLNRSTCIGNVSSEAGTGKSQPSISTFFAPSRLSATETHEKAGSPSMGKVIPSGLHRSQSTLASSSTAVPSSQLRRVSSTASAPPSSAPHASDSSLNGHSNAPRPGLGEQITKRPRLCLGVEQPLEPQTKSERSRFFSRSDSNETGPSRRVFRNEQDTSTNSPSRKRELRNRNTLEPKSTLFSRFACTQNQSDGSVRRGGSEAELRANNLLTPPSTYPQSDQSGDRKEKLKSILGSQGSQPSRMSDPSGLQQAVQADISFLRRSMASSGKENRHLCSPLASSGKTEAEDSAQPSFISAHLQKFMFTELGDELTTAAPGVTSALPGQRGDVLEGESGQKTPSLSSDPSGSAGLPCQKRDDDDFNGIDEPDRVLVPASDDFIWNERDGDCNEDGTTFSNIPSSGTALLFRPTSSSFFSTGGSMSSTSSKHLLASPSLVSPSRHGRGPAPAARSGMGMTAYPNRVLLSLSASVGAGSEDQLVVSDSDDDGGDDDDDDDGDGGHGGEFKGLFGDEEEEQDEEGNVITPASSMFSSFAYSGPARLGKRPYAVHN